MCLQEQRVLRQERLQTPEGEKCSDVRTHVGDQLKPWHRHQQVESKLPLSALSTSAEGSVATSDPVAQDCELLVAT